MHFGLWDNIDEVEEWGHMASGAVHISKTAWRVLTLSNTRKYKEM